MYLEYVPTTVSDFQNCKQHTYSACPTLDISYYSYLVLFRLADAGWNNGMADDIIDTDSAVNV